MMQTHVLYTGGTLGMLSTPNGLAPGADLTGWLNQLLSGTELAGTFETLSFEHLIDSARSAPVTFGAASVPTTPNEYCAPVTTTGLPNSVRA